MAIKRFTGAIDGNLNTAGNWSPSGKPTTNDDAIFDNVAVNVTVGFSPPVALNNLHATSRFTGNWGASGSPIDGVAISGTMVWEASSQEAWFGSASITRCKFNPRGTGANAAQFVGSGLGIMRFVSGRVNLDTTVSMGDLTVLEAANDPVMIGPEVIIASGVAWGANQRLIINTGRVQLYAGPNGTTDEFIEVGGGELWLRGGTIDHLFVNGGAVLHDAGTVTNAYLMNGIWDATGGADDRTLTNLYQCGGISDFRNCAGVGKPTTFDYLGGETTLPEESYTL
jgi:hypothetical protein